MEEMQTSHTLHYSMIQQLLLSSAFSNETGTVLSHSVKKKRTVILLVWQISGSNGVSL
jgi:hypothetical protein